MALICIKASVATGLCQVQSVAEVSSNTRQSEPPSEAVDTHDEGKETEKHGLWKVLENRVL